jgi:hypothetical protein
VPQFFSLKSLLKITSGGKDLQGNGNKRGGQINNVEKG